MKGFEIVVQRLESGPVHVRVRGALDLGHAYRFDDAMRRVERGGDHCIVVDLSELDFLDSTGIARLVALRRRARRTGRRLVLVRGSRAVQRLFSLAALTEHFEIVGDVAAVVGPAPRRGR
jgi:anti-anti-sigma factor